ncbi:MAG: phage major capsid protein [Chloroflexota bacterium]|nr:phage major capsid protein [Chloroflexota bacterium]MDE2950971.1 phage major capsid protein [Chloroflexota bacterium]
MKASTVKMIDAPAGRIGGYMLVWGEADRRDLQGEFFTPQTDVGLDWYEQRPVLYHHGLDGALKAAVIGVIDTLRPDDTGLWAEAQLDLHKRYVRAVRRLVDLGVLSWSSGSLPHLVDVGEGGQIKCWPIVEGSLTPTPAEPRQTDVQTLKSAYKSLGLDLSRLGIEAIDSPDANGASSKGASMTATPSGATKRLPLADEREAIRAGRIKIDSEFDSLDAMDMLHGYMLLRSTKSFHGVSERYSNALSQKVGKAELSAIKADELAYSTQTGFGDEWAPDLWSQQIWHKARQDNTILPLFQSVEMPSNPFELPIEGTDPKVYYVPETSDEAHLSLGAGNPIPDSKIGSRVVTLNAKKLALRVGFSSELVEDAMIPVLNIYRQQAVRAIADAIDNVLLNGDATTAASGNINRDHAAPPATAKYLSMNGLRHLPLVENTGNRINLNGAPSLAKMREARFKMPAKYAARPSDLAWIVDSGTYAKLLGIDEFLTMDKAGPRATAQTGQIGLVDGIPVYVSAEMPLTEADGKVGGGGNNRGQALCVYRPGWTVGYRRKIAVSVDYLSYYDSYQLTATVRLAFARFDSEVASCLYNIVM